MNYKTAGMYVPKLSPFILTEVVGSKVHCRETTIPLYSTKARVSNEDI